jgi:hypothetical protein
VKVNSYSRNSSPTKLKDLFDRYMTLPPYAKIKSLSDREKVIALLESVHTPLEELTYEILEKYCFDYLPKNKAKKVHFWIYENIICMGLKEGMLIPSFYDKVGQNHIKSADLGTYLKNKNINYCSPTTIEELVANFLPTLGKDNGFRPLLSTLEIYRICKSIGSVPLSQVSSETLMLLDQSSKSKKQNTHLRYIFKKMFLLPAQKIGLIKEDAFIYSSFSYIKIHQKSSFVGNLEELNTRNNM